MAVAPNHQKLIVPGKNYKGVNDPYARDMRAIEMWANEGIVRKLIAGPDITLNPSSGIDAGQGIEISATGGGTSVGYLQMFAGPDDALNPNQIVWMGIGGNPGAGYPDLFSSIPLFSNATGSPVVVSFAAGWMTKAGIGQSVALLPEFVAPAFTGSDISIDCELSAADATFTNFGVALGSTALTFTSGQDTQFADTDFSFVHGGADLSLVAGSGQNGNGIVSAAGGVYWGGITGHVTIPDGVTFT